MTFESACFHRYGGETWARVLLACGCIDPVHIQAINMEIARRIQEGDNREPDDEGRLVNDDVMRQWEPKVVLDHSSDGWGGAVLEGTNRPATLLHCAMKAFC